jgi:hypothetical protein
VETAVVEIQDVLFVEPFGVRVGVGDGDDLGERGAIW